jgi:hypothetical protein
MDNTIREFDRLYPLVNQEAPQATGPRASLKVRLSELANAPPRPSWSELFQASFSANRWLHTTAVLLAVGSVIVLQFTTLSVGAASTPDAALTPGLARTTSKHDICSVDGADMPAVTTSMALEVFKQYGIRRPKPRAYEVDYLITPALGGAHDVRNLWPQPYSVGTWNAHVKDALEDHLYHLVCQGTIDLPTAQRDIATNWITAYKKYFRSEQPLPIHVKFQKDPPWE